ncbi:hypothetical protein ACLOJK_006282 [Asimina triloba]
MGYRYGVLRSKSDSRGPFIFGGFGMLMSFRQLQRTYFPAIQRPPQGPRLQNGAGRKRPGKLGSGGDEHACTRQRPGHGRCPLIRSMETPTSSSPPNISPEHSRVFLFLFSTPFKPLFSSSPPNQDAVLELSEHGIVLIVEEIGCLQAKVYLKRELFVSYEYTAEGRPRFGLSLGLFIDCLNTFSTPGHSTVIEIRYPGPDMQLLLRSIDSPHACVYAEVRTRIPETISWDYNFEPTGNVPVSFTVKSAVLKEAIDDLEWPGSSIQITLQPDPACVTFRGEGHGDLQVRFDINCLIDFLYYANADLLIAFQCNQQVSYRYKYKFLRATTSNIPSTVLKDNRGSKLTIGRGGILKIQHLVSVVRPGAQHLAYGDPGGYPQPNTRHARIFAVRLSNDPCGSLNKTICLGVTAGNVSVSEFHCKSAIARN